MSINYFDKVLYLYPDIQRVCYWHTQYDGTPWKDPYEGLKWENPDIKKPSKKQLDALDDEEVRVELEARAEIQRKQARDAEYASDLSLVAKYVDSEENNFSEYLDKLEQVNLKSKAPKNG